MRTLITLDPPYDRTIHYHENSPYKARWVSHPNAPQGTEFEQPFVALYRLQFSVAAAIQARVHVSADERYTLWLDGNALGRGPERCDRDHWSFETFDLEIAPGTHELIARVHSLGRHRPYAQVSVRHGLLLLAEGSAEALLSTGIAAWEAAHIDAYGHIPAKLPRSFIATGGRFRIDGGALKKSAFVPVAEVGPAVPASARMESPGQWQLSPALLPPMYEKELHLGRVRHIDHTDPDKAGATQVHTANHEASEVESWQAFLQGKAPLTIPAHATRRVIIDLDNYYCAYPIVTTRGGKGSVVRLHTAEALFEADGFTKSHRNQVDGLYFFGQGDDLLPDGEDCRFEPLWWLSGRYVQISIRTADEPLTLSSLSFVDTHYPFQWDTTVQTSEPKIAAFQPIAIRVLEMCSHETYFDCPYYEQLMYVGDTRLEVLTTYALTRDDRLPRKAITLFDHSRAPDGWTSARYPTKTAQTIPPFSLWWVCMVHDFMMWRDDPAFVRERMPGVRAVTEAARACVGDDGLFYPPQGWNYVDWIAQLGGATAPGNSPGAPRFGPGPTASLHYQFAYTLRLAAELEDYIGEPALAGRHRALLDRMKTAGQSTFWNAERKLFRELPARIPVPEDGATRRGWKEYTEHAQCLAVLSGSVMSSAQRQQLADALFSSTDLAPTTIYYTHYLFETCRELDRIDMFFKRLELWYTLPERGFKTTFEMPEPTRSDCHAWGAHPLFHLYATILGVRPAAPGFARVHIEPRLGSLAHVQGTLAHPRGTISIRVERDGADTRTTVSLPAGVSGELKENGRSSVVGK